MKHLIWIGILLFITVAGDRFAGSLLENMTINSGFRYSRMYRDEAGADILLVGNSRGLTFYQPALEKITQKSTFNLSYNGMPMNLGKVLIEDYYSRYKAPAFLLIDVTMCDRKNAELLAGFNCYTGFSQRLYDTLYQSDASSAIGGRLSHLYRFNSEVFQRALFYRNDKDDEDWLLDRVITKGLVDGISGFHPDTIQIVPEMVTCLIETINLARSKGTKVKLVVNPYYPPFVEKLPNFNAFKEYIESKTGLLIDDYSHAVQDESLYGDYQHLNKKGSEVFMEMLVRDSVVY